MKKLLVMLSVLVLECFYASASFRPATGIGNKFGVRIGDQGEVIEILMWHPVLVQNKTVAVITPSEALNIIETTTGNFPVPINCNNIVIEEISIAYYLSSITEKQEYLMPVYVFKGKCLDEKGEYIQNYIDWVEAIKK